MFLSNLLPGRQRRFGLDAASLLAVRPRLVHATFTGYGTTGPDAERPGYDVTAFFGRGAITDSMTEPDGVAPQPRPAQGDHAAAMALVAGVLAALRLAERSGEGQVVEASLLGMATWTMATDLAPVLVDGRQPSKRDRHHLITPLANRFRCADDRWIVLNMPEGHWWPKFCRTVDREAWLDDPRFETVKSRFDHMPELIDLLDEVFAAESLADVGPHLRRSRPDLGAGGHPGRPRRRPAGRSGRALPRDRGGGGAHPDRGGAAQDRRRRHRAAGTGARAGAAHRRGAERRSGCRRRRSRRWPPTA